MIAHQDIGAVPDRRMPIVVDGLSCAVPTVEYGYRLRQAGVSCVHLSVEDMDSRGGIFPFERVFRLLEDVASPFRLVRSYRELVQAVADEQIALVLGWQGADPAGVELGSLLPYYQFGLRILGITYNVTNRFGGGCLTPKDGLTAEGAKLVEEAISLGILLDIGGHTGELTSFGVIERLSGRPAICSHTCMYALNPNPRNISDELCRAIAATGGVIGFTPMNDFLVRNAANASVLLSPQAKLDIFISHLEYARDLVGIDHIGIGSDFMDGVRLDEPTAWAGDRYTPAMVSEGTEVVYCEGFESIDRLPFLAERLAKRGWTPVELGKLMGENWCRVYAAAW